MDNLSTGFEDNIEAFKQHPNFSFHEQSVEAPLDFEVDTIYHLACPASPKAYQADPIEASYSADLPSLLACLEQMS